MKNVLFDILRYLVAFLFLFLGGVIMGLYDNYPLAIFFFVIAGAIAYYKDILVLLGRDSSDTSEQEEFNPEHECEKLLIGGHVKGVVEKIGHLLYSWRELQSSGRGWARASDSAVAKAIAEQNDMIETEQAVNEYSAAGNRLLKDLQVIQRQLKALVNGIVKDDDYLELDASLDQISFYARNLIRQINDADKIRKLMIREYPDFARSMEELERNSGKDIEAEDDRIVYNPTVSLSSYFSIGINKLEAALDAPNIKIAKGTSEFKMFMDIQKEYQDAIKNKQTEIANELFSKAKAIVMNNKVEF